MNNFEIDQVLSSTKHIKDIFMGVYSADTLPHMIQYYPSCYVVNTDESTDAGEHWVCIYFNSNQDAEFFCSFANSPYFYDKRILSFVERNCCSWVCNVKRLQSSLSTVCGQYCIFFAVCKSIDVSLKQICSVFCNHYELNDMIVNEYACINFDMKLSVVDVDFLQMRLSV